MDKILMNTKGYVVYLAFIDGIDSRYRVILHKHFKIKKKSKAFKLFNELAVMLPINKEYKYEIGFQRYQCDINRSKFIVGIEYDLDTSGEMK